MPSGMHPECDVYYPQGFIIRTKNENPNANFLNLYRINPNKEKIHFFAKVTCANNFALKIDVDHKDFIKPWLDLYINCISSNGTLDQIEEVSILVNKNLSKEQEALLEALIRLNGLEGLKNYLDL